MATTTAFGWSTPDDTSLVKDGAAAIRTLGQSIDTSMAELKGGTTGQVLSKTSNTDMDFTWVAQDDSNAIQNAIVDAKGDLIAASAADTPARLAVGTNGQVLTADSTAATGLAWATASSGSSNVAGKNGAINSNFSVWQRGTSFTAASVYTADRWFSDASSTRTTSRQATGDTTNLPNIQYCARVQRNSGQTSTTAIGLLNPFETVNSIPFAGKVVTLSFYARAGANFSGSSNNLSATVWTGTGTDQRKDFSASYTGEASPVGGTSTLTTTWQRFSFSGTIAATVTELTIGIYYVPSGTAGANDYFEVTGVQLEIASSATAYSPNAATQAAELAACMRYYELNSFASGTEGMAIGFVQNATTARYAFAVVPKRTTPTVAYTGTLQVEINGGTTISATGLANTKYGGASLCSFYLTVASGLTGGQACCLYASGSTVTISFDSEL